MHIQVLVLCIHFAWLFYYHGFHRDLTTRQGRTQGGMRVLEQKVSTFLLGGRRKPSGIPLQPNYALKHPSPNQTTQVRSCMQVQYQTILELEAQRLHFNLSLGKLSASSDNQKLGHRLWDKQFQFRYNMTYILVAYMCTSIGIQIVMIPASVIPG